MTLRQLCLTLLGIFALIGCAKTPQPEQTASENFRPRVENEITAAVREFFTGFSTAKCDDVAPVSKFARDGMIYVTDTEIYTVPLSAYEQGLRDRTCNWISHTGGIDSIKVEALSRDVGVAAWMYHDVVVRKSGETIRTKGSVLMTLVKYPSGWKITSTLSNDKIVQ